MSSIQATTEDVMAMVLTLGTEENTQEFFAWCRGLSKDPTPQECFEKAWDIRESNGPWPDETEDAERDSQGDGATSPDEQSN